MPKEQGRNYNYRCVVRHARGLHSAASTRLCRVPKRESRDCWCLRTCDPASVSALHVSVLT